MEEQRKKHNVKIGMLGYGRIGKIHALVNQMIPFVCEEKKILPRIVKIYSCSCKVEKNSIFTNGPEDVINDNSLDVVDICTPNNSHKNLALHVIKSGKAIYLEKPIALNSHQAWEVVKAVESTSLVNQCGLIYRFLPGINGLREMILNGEIGEIIDFNICALHSGYLDEDKPIAWNLKKESSGGGPLLDLGIHLVDAVRYLLGECVNICAFGDCVIPFRPDMVTGRCHELVDVEDWGQCILTLSNGCRGTIRVSRVAAQFREQTWFEIYGKKGRLYYNVINPLTIFYYSRERNSEVKMNYIPHSDFGHYLMEYYPCKGMDMGWFLSAQLSSLASFYHQVTIGKKEYDEIPDFKEGAKAQEIIDAAYESIETNNSIVHIN